MEDIRTMLDREYEETLAAVSLATTGSDEAKWQLQKLNDLHKQRMAEMEAIQKASQHDSDFYYKEKELQLKEAQMKDGKKDRIIKIVLDSAAILVPVTVSSFWMAKGLKFEENGTFTSHTGQWLSSHLRLFRK